MATGTIVTGHKKETITLNLDTTKVSIASWGGATAKRIGNIIYIRLYGVAPKSTMTNATTIGTYTGPPAQMGALAPLLTAAGVEGRCGVDEGSNSIFFAGISNLDNRFSFIIIPV